MSVGSVVTNDLRSQKHQMDSFKNHITFVLKNPPDLPACRKSRKFHFSRHHRSDVIVTTLLNNITVNKKFLETKRENRKYLKVKTSSNLALEPWLEPYPFLTFPFLSLDET